MTVRGITSFLKGLPSKFKSLNPSACVFVTGNEATDLDSTICALSTAFVKQQYGGKPMIPFINCSSKAVINMRGELQDLLRKLGITQDDLIFKNEVLDKCAKAGERLDVFLVDHNEVSTSWQLGHLTVAHHVVGIIDHHADGKEFMDAQPRIVRVCGSNASLLLEYFHESPSQDELDRLEEVKEYLLSAIIMDTVHFTWRVTDTDVNWASKILTGLPNAGVEKVQQLTKGTMDAFDAMVIPETSFSIADLVYKDFKLFCHNDTYYYALSALKTSFASMIDGEFGGDVKAFVEVVKKFMEKEHISLFCITLAVREPGSYSFYQQLGYFCIDGSVDLKQLNQFVDDSGAITEPIWIGEDYAFYMQNNPNVSRKQLQPYFEAFLDKTRGQQFN